MSNKDKKSLNSAIGTLKSKLTLFRNYLNVNKTCALLSDVQLLELECRLNKILPIENEYDQLQTELESLEENPETAYAEREKFYNDYYAQVALARSLLGFTSHRHRRESDGGSSGASGSRAEGHSPHDFVRLPKISLPSYNGDFQHWLEFRDTYLSIIHNNSGISDINKYHYLRSTLKGSAALVIKSLDVTAHNYKVAWQLLTERYDNERLLINNHLSAIFNLEPAKKESSHSIRNIIDVTNKNLCSLESLGQPTDHWDTLIIYIMSKKLDSVTYRQWEEHRSSIKSYPNLKQFLDFLLNRADFLDTIQANNMHNSIPTHLQNQPSHSSSSYKPNQTNNIKNTNTNTKINSCPLCKQDHFLFSCQPFRDLDVETRLQKMANFKVCKNCLRPGHTEKYCRLSHCKYCNQKHNTLLHREIDNEVHNNVVLSTDVQNINRPPKMVSTALVKVADAQGSLHTARIVLDNCSTSHLVTQSLCEKLGLVRQSTISTVTGINNQLSHSTESCDLTFQSFSGDYKVDIDCLVVSDVSKTVPSAYIHIEDLNIPPSFQLADPSFHVPSAIDILVAADVFWDVLYFNTFDLGKGGLKLQKTKLGWIVRNSLVQKSDQSLPSNCFFTQNDDVQLTRFWELDSVSPVHNLSPEEQACEKLFAETTRRDEEGRFVVTIPLKNSPDVLGDSYAMAKRRFLSLERRCDSDPVLKERCVEFMNEYLQLGHMSENSDSSQNQYNNYIPQHAVIRETSTTTKLRMVADAAAATTSGKSFNSIQMVGPVVQDDLFSILLRFRQHKYVVSGDIEKMYRCILVEPTQRSLQQIVFRFNKSERLKTYFLNTITYGTSSAPYLATKCLVSLADECSNPNSKNAIKRDFYVDDFLSGGDSIQSVTALCTDVIDTLKSANFNLRKFQSNNSEILQNITQTPSHIHTEKELNLQDTLPNKTLGLRWDSSSDTLLFSIDLDSNKKKITKRIILSLISQVFDPLGLLGLCTVEAKIIMQGLWVDKCSWDQEVSSDIRTKFLDFVSSLPALNDLRIPRWVSGSDAINIELHTFTDASERAYGACVFVRTVSADGSVYVHLLSSKNKVAPLKPTTIPRLELCGALLGTRLCTKVRQSLTLNFQNCFFWTDSTIVLGWLNTPPSRLKTFVRNRVGEIQDSTSGCQWSYVPSKENPADLVSRGVKADRISDSTLWWNGPNYLHSTEIKFPKIPNTHSDTLPEINLHIQSDTDKQNTDNTNKESENIITELIHRKSEFKKLIRIIAYIYRFINNCRKPDNKINNNLQLSELQTSERTILLAAQQEMFPEEYNVLKSGLPLKKSSRLLSLSPFIDEHNLLRVGGRLSNSNYSYDIKHPILLCSKHHLTHIIFQNTHTDLFHAGPSLLLSHIHQKYWPVGGRNLAKRVTRKCVRCFRFKSKTLQPIMSDLCFDRTNLEFPFLVTGIDYAGPVLILDRKGRGGKLTKSYICVMVCFACKALNLELVSNLTKEAFLAALHRFMARRGKPQTIYSDNGTTFVGASNELTSFINEFSDDIQNDLHNQGIEFKNIPPYSPHFGGLWEAAVKSVKFHLRRVLSLAHLTYEEMYTCLVQIEAILNSRPLTPLSSDPSDFTCLTPSHFLIGRSLLSVPQPQLTEVNVNRLQRFQRIEKLKQHFWQRYSHEYVSLLQQKVKWTSSSSDLQLGSLVLVRDRNQPPLLWLLGRIIKIHPGKDNVNRVADIRTKKGVIQRAYNNICPLPTSS